jgi:predicted nucleic acid-binding protein
VHPLTNGNFAISVITEIEAFGYKGINPSELKILKELRDSITVLFLGEPIKDIAVQLRKDTNLRVPDAIVAATALALNAELFTNRASLAFRD